ADGAAGVEVVIHGSDELGAARGSSFEFGIGRRCGRGVAGLASYRSLQCVEILAGDPAVALEEPVETFQADAGFFDGGLVEGDRAAIVRAEQKEADSFTALAFDEVSQTARALGAAHLACGIAAPDLVGTCAGSQESVMGPVGDHRFVVAGFALGYFVFVMW